MPYSGQITFLKVLLLIGTENNSRKKKDFQQKILNSKQPVKEDTTSS